MSTPKRFPQLTLETLDPQARPLAEEILNRRRPLAAIIGRRTSKHAAFRLDCLKTVADQGRRDDQRGGNADHD